jgi:protein-tyrosine phosphatase
MSLPASPRAIALSFVCSGNICRSPTAEAIMRRLAADAGLDAALVLDSAGTGDWHVGERRDHRSVEVARRRGMPITGVARHFQRADFARFDYVLALDRGHLRELRALAPDAAARGRVHLLRAFDPDAPPDADVPDPYYGGPQGLIRS